MSESIVAMLAAFRGEHLVLQPGDEVQGAIFNQFPRACLGLPGVVLHQEEADERETLQVLRWLLGKRADVLTLRFVARIWAKNGDGLYQLQLVYTCIMGGYFEGTGFKPAQLPENFYPGHARSLEYVMYSRERNGFG